MASPRPYDVAYEQEDDTGILRFFWFFAVIFSEIKKSAYLYNKKMELWL